MNAILVAPALDDRDATPHVVQSVGAAGRQVSGQFGPAILTTMSSTVVLTRGRASSQPEGVRNGAHAGEKNPFGTDRRHCHSSGDEQRGKLGSRIRRTGRAGCEHRRLLVL